MYQILPALFLLIISLANANAQADETQEYYRAYNICAPTAESQAMKECNYIKLVENSYIACMSKNGYKESDEITDRKYYDKYLKIHQICSGHANGEARRQCNYGIIFQFI